MVISQNQFFGIESIFRVMGIIESLGFLCTLIYLYFVMRQDHRAWYWSMSGSIFIAYSCITSQLYIQGMLYIFYLAIAVIGLRSWRYSDLKTIQVNQMKFKYHLIFLFVTICLGFILGFVFTRFTEQQLPYLDGIISISAVGCTVLVVSKFRENWLYWMLINASSAYLYASQGLWVFVVMSIVLFFVAIRGFFFWNKEV